MFVYRLTKQKYAGTLSGKGAAISGNRWNSKGVKMIYTAESRALALVEVLVHLPLQLVPSDFMMMRIEIPDALKIETLDMKLLPTNWNVFPHLMETQYIGDRFIVEKKAVVLKVPSAIVSGDFNYLINPYHPDFNKIKNLEVSPFMFNGRFFRK